MRISREKLTAAAGSTGFRQDMLEKVAQLLNLLNALRSHTFLKGKWALKGGTALNLFYSDVPRLSVDIDLNYVGAEELDAMQQERPRLEQAFRDVFSREDLKVRHFPDNHAGGKWRLRYQSAKGGEGNLEVDISFMYRVPLWSIETRNSQKVGAWQSTSIPVVELHELAAGKLAALFARKKARDLFDCHRILHSENLDRERLRTAFVAYGAMNRKDWRSVSIEDVEFDAEEIAKQLIPTLRQGALRVEGPSEFGTRLVKESRQALSTILPFTNAEMEFLNLLLEKGEIKPSLITNDSELQDRIRRHPNLEWKALNVLRNKGFS